MGMFKSGGGGFLNNQVGVIVGYEFETKEWEGKKGKDDYTTLSLKLLVQQDGVAEPVPQFIGAGFFHPDEDTLSDDKLTLSREDGGEVLVKGTYAEKFISSLFAAGFDPAPFNESANNLEPMIGARVTFARIKDEEATKQFGQRAVTKGKSKGKSFDRDYLTVATFHEMVKVGAKGAAKGAAKSAPKAASKATAKATTAPAAAAATVDSSEAEGALLSMLADAKENTLPVGQLNSAVVKYALSQNLDSASRETLRKAVTNADFLATQNGWTLDEKKKTVTLA